MTFYEFFHLVAEPFLPVLISKARREVKQLVGTSGGHPVRLLDVGGRRSPYTIGVKSSVTILDLPRANELQESLDLGITDTILAKTQHRRSNIHSIILEDMTQTHLPSASFDGVISIEVIEHVPDDELFVQQIARVLRPGGWFYMTTPNGDYIRNEPPNHNPDHIRHYTQLELAELLSRHFSEVQVSWGIHTGKHRVRGLRGPSIKHLYMSLQSMLSNVINRWQSRDVANQSQRTGHLFATCRKSEV